MLARCLRHRAPVLWLLLPFMGGLIAGKTSPYTPPAGALLAGALASATFAAFAVTTPRRWAAALVLAATLAGTAAYEIHRARLPAWASLPPREARLTLRIERTFASSNPRRVSGVARIVAAETHLGDLRGQRLYFSLTPLRAGHEVARGAEIAAVGVLQTLPRNSPLDTFDGYLVAAGLNFQLTRGQLGNTVRAPSAYARFCARTQERFSTWLGRGLERRPEMAGALRAMMLGQTQELNDEQTLRFRHSGTMHLFAISGLHIGVIAAALQGLLIILRLPHAARFVLTLTALWLYVDITGASPSAVRAFIMIALVIGSRALWLPVNPVATLGLAALITLLVDPMELFAASFQMSYGIVAALLLLGLPLAEDWQARLALFRDLPKATWTWSHRALDKAWRWTLSALAIGVATSGVSTVFGVIYFNLFTPGALLANFFLIPASGVAILAGFASLLAGLAGLAPLCALFNLVAGGMLTAMDAALAIFLRLPGMFHEAGFVRSWAGWTALLVLLASLFFGYAHGWERRRGGFWAPFALTSAALVLAVKFV